MGGCATKPTKLQAAAAGMKQKEEEAGVVGVVKEVVQVETKEIEGGRKSLSFLFMENKVWSLFLAFLLPYTCSGF